MTTFKTYVEWINKLYVSRPDLHELQVITATDDEGNWFNEVYYKPTPGHFDAEAQAFYIEEGKKTNAIRLN